MRNNCTWCGEKFTKENESEEHIIPNALGGKLKSIQIFCKICNNILDKIDAELIKAVGIFDNFLLIKRDRKGKHTTIFGTNSQGEFCIKDGIPEFTKFAVKNPDGSTTIRTVDVKNREKVLEGLMKIHGKVPNFKTIQEKLEPIKIPVEFISPPVWRGLGKILFSAAHFFNETYVPSEESLRPLVEQPFESGKKYCKICFAPVKFKLLGNPPGVPDLTRNFFHAVIIDFRPAENCVIGYVQLFNMPYIALIDGKYSGPAMCKAYYVNPINGDQYHIEPAPKINISRQELEGEVENWLTKDTIQLFHQRITKNLTQAIEYNEIERLFHESAKEVGLKLGDPLTEDFIKVFVKKLENSNLVERTVKNMTLPNRVWEALGDNLFHGIEDQWIPAGDLQSRLKKVGYECGLDSLKAVTNELANGKLMDRVPNWLKVEIRDKENGSWEARLIPR